MEPFQRSDILLASCVRDLFGRRGIFNYIRRIVRRYIEVPDGAPVFFDKLVTGDCHYHDSRSLPGNEVVIVKEGYCYVRTRGAAFDARWIALPWTDFVYKENRISRMMYSRRSSILFSCKVLYVCYECLTSDFFLYIMLHSF